MRKLLAAFRSMTLAEKLFCALFYILSFATVLLAMLGFVCLLLI